MTQRRLFLKNLGLTLGLPFLPSLFPQRLHAQVNRAPSKFIGVYFPDGTYMPKIISSGQSILNNGFWTFQDSLAPLLPHKDNILILRGFKGGQPDLDIHWTGCGGWLSCGAFAPNPTKIAMAKSIDQYIADQKSNPIRSLHVGWKYRSFSEHPESHSPIYLNNLSWRTDEIANTNYYSVNDLFNRVFSSGNVDSQRLVHQQGLRKSIIDSHLSDLATIKRKISSEENSLLDSYLNGLREIEKDLNQPTPACQDAGLVEAENIESYNQHFQMMQRIIVEAMSCGLTDVATIMYDAGVGDLELIHSGVNLTHHSYAHHGNNLDQAAFLKKINMIHTQLFSDLIGQLKAKEIFSISLLALGTDMADGHYHGDQNIPFVLAGGLSEVRWGEEIGDPNTPLFHGDILMEVLSLYGIQIPTLGAGPYSGNGRPVGIRRTT